MRTTFATLHVMIIIKNILLKNILGLTMNNNLDFSDHISYIRKTANQKLNALFRESVGKD